MLEQLDSMIGVAVILLTASLVVTLAVQVVSSVVAFRGRNLLASVELLLHTAAPTLGDDARTVAEKVLQHPLVSDSLFVGRKWLEQLPVPPQWKRATAIRPAELVATLEAVLADAKQPGGDAPSWVGTVDALLKRGRKELEDSLRSPATGEQLPAAVSDEISRISNRAVEAIVARVAPDVAAGQAQVESFLRRFDSAMDRAAQRFRTEARVVAVVASFLLAGFVGLDVIELYGRFAEDSTVRAAIVESADVTLSRASAALAVDSPETRARLRRAALAVAGAQTELPEDKTTQEQLEAWLLELPTTGEPPASHDAGWVRGRFAAERAKLEMTELSRAIESLRTGAGLGGVAPRGWSGFDVETPWEKSLHLFGVLVGALLLSLGAPFWFNALKTLVALRPLVATKEQREAEERKTRA